MQKDCILVVSDEYGGIGASKRWSKRRDGSLGKRLIWWLGIIE